MFLKRASMCRALLVGLALYLGSSCQASTSPDTASAPIGAAGGMVTLTNGTAKGTSVMLPPGALDTMVDIQIGVAATPATTLPDGVSSRGPTIQLGPEGQEFTVPVTITIPATAGADTLYTRHTGDTAWGQVPGARFDATQGVMTAEVSHFSQWVAAKGSAKPFLFSQPVQVKACPKVAGASAVADFNKDGNPDVVLACGNVIFVELGKGDGTFRDPLQTPLIAGESTVGSVINRVLVGDWNGDGKVDLVRESAASLRLLTGKGDGTFTTVFDVGAISGLVNSNDMVGGDFTGDGKLDLAFAFRPDGTMRLLPGNGAGNFDALLSVLGPFKSTPLFPFGVDVNGDHQLDIVFVEPASGNIGVMLNAGCNLNPPIYTPFSRVDGRLAVQPTSGDFNGDGKLDLASLGRSGLSVLLGNGDGTFAPPKVVLNDTSVVWVRSGDLDGDGKLDLVVALGKDLVILPGDGNGSFTGTRVTFAGVAGNDVLLVDLNRDKKLDMVLIGFAGSPMSVMLNQAPQIMPPAQPPTPTQVQPSSLANSTGGQLAIIGRNFRPGISVTIGGLPCANPVLDGTGGTLACTAPAHPMACGPQKIVLANDDGTTASNSTLFQYTGSGLAFAAPVPLATGSSPDHVLAIDLNGDGKLDLANTNRGTNNVTVRLGNGDGTFGNSTGFAVGSTPIGLAAADVNGDGSVDLLTAEYGSGQSSVLLGDGKGGFPTILANPGSGGHAVGVAVGDFNGDKKLDALLSDLSNDGVSLLLGDGTGKLTFKGNIAVQQSPEETAVADFNRDGKLDFVVTNNFTNSVSVALGNGDGTFRPRQDIPVPGGPLGLRLADLNNDGNIDVIVANVANNNVAVLLGNGLGGFAAVTSYPVGTSPRDASIADFNGDRIPDLLVANNGSNNVSVLIGVGDGTFKPALDFPAGSGPFVAVSGDFNGDGLQDFVSTNINANTLSISLQQCK